MRKWIENGVAKILNKIDPISDEKEKRNKEQGIELEYRVFNTLDELGLRVLHSCYIPTKHSYTEVDIIAIGDKGIYVLELKNYTGKVVMTDKDNWYVYYGDKKFELYNPYKQNQGHIKWLQLYLNNMDIKYFHNIVLFPNKTELYNKDMNNHVIQEMQLLEHLEKLENNFILKESAINKIYNKILPTTQVSDLVKRRQLKRAKIYSERGN